MLEKIKPILNFKLSFSALIGISAAVILSLLIKLSFVTISILILLFTTSIVIFYYSKYKSLISFCCFFIVGLVSSEIYNQNNRVYPLESKINDEKAWVKGTIKDIKVRNKYARLTLTKTEIYSDLLEKPVQNVIVSTFSSRIRTAKIGDEFVAKVLLKKPTGKLFKDDFDYAEYLLQNKINLTAQVRGELFITPPEGSYSFIEQILNYRLTLVDKIQDDYKESPEVAGVTTALITGMKGLIPQSTKENFRNSGLAHLMAISGMHMAFLFGFIFVMIRYFICLFPKVALNFSSKKIACVVGVGFAGFYLILAGATLPTIRAFSMVLIFSITIMLNRIKIALHSLCVIAILILLFDPMAIFSASFQLSFAAVFAILIYNQAKKDELIIDFTRLGKSLRGISNVVNISIVAFCATMFFVASHFGYISIYSIFANIISSVLMTILVMPCLIVYFIGCLLFDVQLFSSLNEFSISILSSVAQYFANFADSSVYISPSYSFVLLASSCVVIGLIVLDIPRKYILSACILFISFIVPVKFNLRPEIVSIKGNQAIAVRNNDQITILGHIDKRDLRKVLRFYKLEQSNIDLPKTCDVSGCVYSVGNKTILLPSDEFSPSVEDYYLVDYVIFSE
ncbi:MAG: ComEC family competence protein [Proteobacteria bacterium]|nr:ComEC family competence protein [Pseudomonadota bacterium]